MSSDRFEFYSKSKMEIPPLIDCIAHYIVENPDSIHADPEVLLPRAITAEWISAQPAVMTYLVAYIQRFCLRGKSWDMRLAQLPTGLQWLWSICVLWSEVNNGGFAQFISNGFMSKPENGPVPECLEATRGLRLDDLADLLQSTGEIVDAAVRNQRGDDLDKAFDEFEKKFDQIKHTLAPRIEQYVRAHPEAFAHGPALTY